MALIVETGSVVIGAESYISLATADKYHEAMGNTFWEMLDDDRKESLLRQATQFMTSFYRMKWKGRRTSFVQALDWPRIGVVISDAGNVRAELPDDYIPQEVKNACAELALRANIGPLLKDGTQKAISKSVGPIKVEYAKDSDAGVKYDAINLMLAPYIDQVSGVVHRVARR